MKVYTSYFGNPKLRELPNNVATLSVSNTTPAWFSPHLILSKVNPEWGHINALKMLRISFSTFATLYKLTLSKRFTDASYISSYVYEAVESLDKKYDTVILLCWEKDSKQCHRSVLAEYFGDTYAGEY